MGIVGIGIDLVKIQRFTGIIERRGDKFLKRIFHKNELLNRPSKIKEAQYFAARWAVKEAVWKVKFQNF